MERQIMTSPPGSAFSAGGTVVLVELPVEFVALPIVPLNSSTKRSNSLSVKLLVELVLLPGGRVVLPGGTVLLLLFLNGMPTTVRLKHHFITPELALRVSGAV